VACARCVSCAPPRAPPEPVSAHCQPNQEPGSYEGRVILYPRRANGGLAPPSPRHPLRLAVNFGCGAARSGHSQTISARSVSQSPRSLLIPPRLGFFYLARPPIVTARSRTPHTGGSSPARPPSMSCCRPMSSVVGRRGGGSCSSRTVRRRLPLHSAAWIRNGRADIWYGAARKVE